MFKPDAAGRAFFQYWRDRVRIHGKPTVIRSFDIGPLRIVTHGWPRRSDTAHRPGGHYFMRAEHDPRIWELDLGRLEIRWGTHWRRRRIGAPA